jgi:hypothetical protein
VKSLLGNYQFVQKSPANGFENNNMIYIRYNKDFTISKVYPENMVNGNIVKYSELP